MSGEHTLKAVRGSFIDVTRTVDNPEEIASALRFIEDGLLLIKQGKVEWFGEWEDGKHQIPDTIRVRDYRGKLIVPGFVDTHIHYPQSEMVGAYGEQLLEWLNKHTFPTERRYEDLEYAREMSAFFIKQLLRNGTTTALVFGTVHPQSVDALFEAASHMNMRMIAGKVMMDRNAPDYLLDTAESSYHQSKELIERWHKNGRTPRIIFITQPLYQCLATQLPRCTQFIVRKTQTYLSPFFHKSIHIGILIMKSILSCHISYVSTIKLKSVDTIFFLIGF